MNPREIAAIIDSRIEKQLERVYNKQYLRGIVDSVVGQKADVFIEGSTTAHPNIACIGSYRPAVGDKVLLLSIGTSGANYVILGCIDFDNFEWIAPTLQNSWVNYDSNHAQAGYMKDSEGFVHLRGLIKSGSTGNIFVLPAGFRHSKHTHFPTVSNGTFAYLRVDQNGQVSATGYNNTWLSMDGVTFAGDA